MDKFKFEEIIKAKALNVVKTERAQFVRRHVSIRAKNRMFRAQKFVDKTHRPTIGAPNYLIGPNGNCIRKGDCPPAGDPTIHRATEAMQQQGMRRSNTRRLHLLPKRQHPVDESFSISGE